jgi:16S rRNA (uracil1498-N3)-methyltransferase
MPRFYLPPEQWRLEPLSLTDAEAHHCRNVLRLGVGEQITVFNGLGVEATAKIDSLGDRAVHLRKIEERSTPPPACRITLAQAIPKGKNMDLIVQKAVELGAAEIIPLITERTVVYLDQRGAAQKQSKWQNIAIEAAKQCGQNWLPEVRTPRTITVFFNDVEAGVSPATLASEQPARLPLHQLRLIGSLEPGARSLKIVLRDHSTRSGGKPTAVLILVGPEGDFTPAEYTLAHRHGCEPVAFGPIILRVETAAIYCLSVLSYELSG